MKNQQKSPVPQTTLYLIGIALIVVAVGLGRHYGWGEKPAKEKSRPNMYLTAETRYVPDTVATITEHSEIPNNHHYYSDSVKEQVWELRDTVINTHRVWYARSFRLVDTIGGIYEIRK